MYTLHTLPNKLKVISVSQSEGTSVTLLLLFPIGSRYETRKMNGVSHFVEHLLFKGTKKRPSTLHIAKELDAIGAEYNAFTSKEYTGYYIKTTPNHIEYAADVLSDILYNSQFDAKEVERERKVILEEIKMYQDNPIMHIGDLMEQVIYGDTPLGWSIAGSHQTMTTMPRADVVKYFKSNYRLHEAVFAVSGACTEKQAVTIAKKYFAKTIEKKSASSFPPYVHAQKKPNVIVDPRSHAQQTQLGLMYPAFGYDHPQGPALNLLSVVLGGNMSSRLFIKVRERLSLAYSVRASVDNYRDIGYFSVTAGVDPKRAKEAVRTIVQELAKAAEKGVTAKELESAKTFIEGHMMLRMEDSEFIANWYSTQALFYKKMKSIDERLAQVRAVTLADVKKVAQQVLVANKANLAVIGPHTQAEAVRWL